MNKTDSATLCGAFDTLRDVINAPSDALARCPGLGPAKVRRLHAAFGLPFAPRPHPSAAAAVAVKEKVKEKEREKAGNDGDVKEEEGEDRKDEEKGTGEAKGGSEGSIAADGSAPTSA